MSTEVIIREENQTPLKITWPKDLRTVRILRYAIGITSAGAFAFGLGWPLHLLTPIFTGIFLSLPLPSPSIKGAFILFGYVALAFAVGLIFSLVLLPYPLIYIPALALVLFHIYYLINRNGSVIFGLMCLIAILLLSMLGNAYESLAMMIALQFAASLGLAVLFYVLAHGLLPDPPGSHLELAQHGFQSGYSQQAALSAIKSTIAVLPLAIIFIAAGWTGQILILVYAAIYSLTPDLAKGRAAGLKALLTTIIGGISAAAFYWLIVAVPEYHFFIALLFLTTLIFGKSIFSDNPLAKYLSSAFTAMLILLGGSMGEGANFTSKFILRILMIGAATLYVVGAMSVLDELFDRIMKKLGKEN